MKRPKPSRTLSSAEIKAEIAAEESQLVLLAQDLSDALLAGENSAPYRGAIDKTNGCIVELRAKLADIEHAEGERRRGETAANARDIAAESHRRHAAFIAALAPPPSPSSLSEFSK